MHKDTKYIDFFFKHQKFENKKFDVFLQMKKLKTNHHIINKFNKGGKIVKR